MAGHSSTFALSAAAAPYGTMKPRLPCCAPRNETTLLWNLLHHSPILFDRETRKNLCNAMRRCNWTHDLNVTSVVLYPSSYGSQNSTHCCVRKTEDWNEQNICVVYNAWRPMKANTAEAFCFAPVLPTPDGRKGSSAKKGAEHLFFYLGFVLRFQKLHLLLV